jgi:predicted RND superfamily exporter protein
LRAARSPAAADQADQSLDYQPLINPARRSPAETGALAVADPILRGELVSADGNVTALIVTFDEPRLERDRAAILGEIYRTVGARLPHGLSAYYNGSIEISATYNRITISNQWRFIPPILALTLIAVYVLFRSLQHALIVSFSIVVSALWTLGLYSALGFGFNILTAMLAPLVVVLAISDDVHVIQQYELERRRGDAKHAFTATIAYLWAPLLGASGTTALGLLSLATSDVLAVRHFGIGAALGVMIDFAISIILVPTLLGFVRPLTDRGEPPHERLLGPLRVAASFATARPRLVLAAGVVLTLAAATGLGRLRIDSNHIGFFTSGHPLTRSAAVIDGSLAGVYSFEVLLEGPPDSLKTPDAMMRIDRLSTAIASLPQVRKTSSVADHVRQTHQVLQGGTHAANSIPTDAPMLAQELFLFSITGDGRREMERLVASDFSTAQIAVRLPSMGSDDVFAAMEEAGQLATREFAGTGIAATITGSGRLFAGLDHYLVRSQISSFVTAFVTILAVTFAIFRSIRYGLLALVPNVFPVIALLGVMGWFDITVNVATVMVASVALGVVDDDTIHFLHRLRRQLLEGRSVTEAARDAATREGGAALITAIINSCGFAVLFLSEYRPSGWFGGLLAMTLGVAFLAEIFLLPATVTLAARFLRVDSAAEEG